MCVVFVCVCGVYVCVCVCVLMCVCRCLQIEGCKHAALLGKFNRSQASVRMLEQKLGNAQENEFTWFTPYESPVAMSYQGLGDPVIVTADIKAWVRWDYADGAKIQLDHYTVTCTTSVEFNDPKSWVLVARYAQHPLCCPTLSKWVSADLTVDFPRAAALA